MAWYTSTGNDVEMTGGAAFGVVAAVVLAARPGEGVLLLCAMVVFLVLPAVTFWMGILVVEATCTRVTTGTVAGAAVAAAGVTSVVNGLSAK